MSTFGYYAHYYDLLYKGKDYKSESEYICNLLRLYAPEAKSILDLGCGTGMHACLLAERDYRVHGVDSSEDMLERARRRLNELPERPAKLLSFELGDARNYRIDRRFDAVISLFHVMSYQITNQDLSAAFATVKHHLNRGGIFIFDCWYGPAVLTDRPLIRVKRLENEIIQLTRIAEPIMYSNENCVDVNYHVFIRNKNSGDVAEIRETHKMHYLFGPEVNTLFAENGLVNIAAEEWLTGREPGFDTWGVCFVGRA